MKLITILLFICGTLSFPVWDDAHYDALKAIAKTLPSMTESCNEVRLKNEVWLSALCKTVPGGSEIRTKLDLGSLLENIWGELEFYPANRINHGSFSRSCRKCKMKGAVLQCECGKGKNNEWPLAKKDLRPWVRNVNGYLWMRGHIGMPDGK